MANNYEYHQSEAMNEDEGACALEPRFGVYNNLSVAPMAQQHHQQLQQLTEIQQQYEPTLMQGRQQQEVAHTVVQVTATPSNPYTTNIAVKGQKIKSKLNPLAPEFYPSYKRLQKNGYTTPMAMPIATPQPHMHHQQMPNAAAMAAAATAAQYGYLDYESTYADWPTYEYDVARYMDYERYMTSHMQRSNTAVSLVRNNYSGSGSAAPPSVSSFQEHPSYENLRKNRSFNRSFSGTSYNFRKHKSSKEVCSRENMRSWYIDKKAEEKRMESWKNMSAEAYQDSMPGTSSKDEFYDLASLKSGDQKDADNTEKHLAEYQHHRYRQQQQQQQQQQQIQQQRPSSPSLPQLLIEEDHSQRQYTRASGGTTESTPRKIKSQRKLKKENTEMSKKKLIMLYPPKRNVSDLYQSSQDSMFTQPNAIEYTSDESFLTQLSSSQQMQSELDKMLNDVEKHKSESETQARRTPTSAVVQVVENSDSLEEFELTTKPSEPKILSTSNSVSPISVIEQAKPRSKPEKVAKSLLEPKVSLNKPKRDVDRSKKHEAAREVREVTQNKSKEPQIYFDESTESSSTREKPLIIGKEPKMVYAPKRKHVPTFSESSREGSRSSGRNSRSAVGSSDTETPKPVHKIYQRETVLVTNAKQPSYTGAIPKARDKDASKNKDISQQSVGIHTTTNSKLAAKAHPTGAIPKAKEAQTNQNRKVSVTSTVDSSTVSKISRAISTKANGGHSTAQKDEKTKTESWLQRPPNGIVANRVQIFANSNKTQTAAVNKAETQCSDKSEASAHKRHASSRTPSSEKRASTARATNTEVVTAKQQPATQASLLKRSTATTAVGAVACTTTTSVAVGTNTNDGAQKQFTAPKPVIKTQMRSSPTGNDTSHSSSRKLSASQHSSHVSQKESIESKKSKSITAGSSRSVYASSSKSLKAAPTKIPFHEKTSSLRGVKAVIGSADGDMSAQVKTSRSCISLRRVSKGLVQKPSLTSTKTTKKSKASETQTKKVNDLATPVSAIRSLQTEKRRNPYSDPSADYKIVHTTLRHK